MHVLAFRLALSHLTQKPFSRIVVVFSMGCILLINALVFLLFQSISASVAEIKASRFVTVYLESTVSSGKETEVLSAVKKVPGVSSAQLVSKDAFIENFSKYFPQLSTELATLDADAIPRFVKVKVSETSNGAVEERLKKLKGVEQVETNKSKYAGLLGALSMLRKLALVLIFGMSVALVCILLNHFKLRSGFQAQVRHTLSVLGARSGQVFLPFAIEGFLEGFSGGALAALALLAYGAAFEGQMNSMFTAIGYHPFHFEVATVSFVLVAVGALSGAIGSVWATARSS